jgi:hypothetical protein
MSVLDNGFHLLEFLRLALMSQDSGCASTGDRLWAPREFVGTSRKNEQIENNTANTISQ